MRLGHAINFDVLQPHTDTLRALSINFHMCQFWIYSGGDFRHGSSSLKQIVRAGFSTKCLSQSLVNIQVIESPLWPADH